jgi:hypothetical protein
MGENASNMLIYASRVISQAGEEKYVHPANSEA